MTVEVQLITGMYTLEKPPSAADMRRIANGERVPLPAVHRRRKVTIFSDQVVAWPDLITVPTSPPADTDTITQDRDRYRQALILAEQQLKITPVTAAAATAAATIRAALTVHPDRDTT